MEPGKQSGPRLRYLALRDARAARLGSHRADPHAMLKITGLLPRQQVAE
jgi:hypothetical protein